MKEPIKIEKIIIKRMIKFRKILLMKLASHENQKKKNSITVTVTKKAIIII